MVNQKTLKTFRPDSHWMQLAWTVSENSIDPHLQVGAVIVRDGQLLSSGYNKLLPGIEPESVPWDADYDDYYKSKLPYLVHAEGDAFFNSRSQDLTGATIYVNIFPCTSCAAFIIRCGIKKLVYCFDEKSENQMYLAERWKRCLKLSREFLILNNIEIIQMPWTKNNLEIKTNK